MRVSWKTEKPPNEEDYYLVQYDSGIMDVIRWTNRSMLFTNQTTDWHWIAKQYCNVIAWMPLPKPWRGE